MSNQPSHPPSPSGPDPFTQARAKLQAEGIALANTPDREAAIKDMELQWQDHWHMRDQTWKTVTNSAIIFISVIGLEVYRVPNAVMIPAYCGLMLLAFYGRSVAVHHRRIQKEEKFEIIRRYELLLGLSRVFDDILRLPRHGRSTGQFVIACHWIIMGIALLLLARRFLGETFSQFLASPNLQHFQQFLGSPN